MRKECAFSGFKSGISTSTLYTCYVDIVLSIFLSLFFQTTSKWMCGCALVPKVFMRIISREHRAWEKRKGEVGSNYVVMYGEALLAVME